MERLGPIEKPAPYTVADRREWIVSEEPENPGFAIFVRTGITNAEQQWLLDQHRDILRYQEEQWRPLPPEEKDLADSPAQRELALIAPYILDWNAWGWTGEGQRVELAPPVVNGAAVFEAIDEVDRAFCRRVVLNGYLGLGKAIRLRSRSSPSGEPSATPTPQETPKRKSSRRPKTSSTPSVSASTDSGPGNTT